MRLARVAIMSLALATAAPVVTVAPGCALFDTTVSSTERFAELQELYILAVRNAIAARSAGRISDTDWRNTVLPAIIRGDEVLDEMDVARENDQLDLMESLRITLRGLIAEIGGVQ